MSINSVLNAGLSSIQASQTALKTTSSNIANLNTPGYNRRVADLQTSVAGGMLAGVDVAQVRRVVDQFLYRQALAVAGQTGAHGVDASYQERLQAYLGDPTGDSNIAAAMSTAMGAITQTSLDPSSTIRRTAAVSEVSRLTDAISMLSTRIQDLRSQADGEVSTAVERINTLIKRIADLNPQIQHETLNGNGATGLVDQRENAIRELAEYLDINVIEQPGGKVLVATVSGLSLVSDIYTQLDYNAPGTTNSSTVYPEITAQRINPATGGPVGPAEPLEPHLRDGKLRGYLDLRNTTLANYAEQLGALGAALADGMNAVHNDSSAVPPPNSMIGRNTGLLATDAHGFTGNTTLAVVDSSGALVRRIDIDFDAGTYAVDGGAAVGFSGGAIGDVIGDINNALTGVGTASFTDGVLSVAATAPTNGIAFQQDASDPSSRGGRGFAHFFGLNDLLTASSPPHFDSGLVATDLHGFGSGETVDFSLRGTDGSIVHEFTLTVSGAAVGDLIADLNLGAGSYGSFALDANGKLAFTPAAAHAGAKLESANDTTARGTTGTTLSALFGLGTRYQMDQALNLGVRSTVAQNPQRLALAKLDLASGLVGDTVLGAGDNRGALALAAVEETTRSIPAAGFLGATSMSVGEYAALFFADLGQRASTAGLARDDGLALQTDIEARASTLEGVNLDEELANMMVFQQAYNAGARLITTAQRMFDALFEALK